MQTQRSHYALKSVYLWIQSFKQSLFWTILFLAFISPFSVVANSSFTKDFGSLASIRVPDDSLGLMQMVERANRLADSGSAHAMLLLDQVIAGAEAQEFKLIAALAYQVKGTVYKAWRAPGKVREAWVRSLEILAGYPPDPNYLELLISVCILELEEEKPNAALHWIQLSEKAAREVGSSGRQAFVHSLYGQAYSKLGKEKIAAEEFQLALEAYEVLEFWPGKMKVLYQSGLAKIQNENYPAAISDLRAAWEVPFIERFNHTLLEVSLGMGDAWSAMGEGDSALYWFQRGLKLAEGLNLGLMDHYEHASNAVLQVAKAYDTLGNAEKAFQFYTKYNLMRNEFVVLNTQNIRRGIEEQYQYLQQIQAWKQQENHIALIRNRNRWLQAGGASACLLSLMLLLLKWNQIRHARRMRAKELVLQEIQWQRVNQDNSVMERNLEEKKRELIQFVTTSLKEEQFFLNLNQNLEEYCVQVNEQSEAQKELLRQLENIPDEAQSWSRFRTYFDQLFPGFLDDLVAAHPKLTSNDVRLLAFLRLGLSSKEIASLSARTSGSIDVSRHRLRNKLGLTSDQQLMHTLLQNLKPVEHEN